MYDLHVHILDHGFAQISVKDRISDYIFKAEMYGFEALGFVDHYELLRKGKGTREILEEARRQTDIALLYGVEMIFPFIHPLPKRFDFFSVHIRRDIDMLETIESLKKLRRPFTIAHPCAFGSFCSDVKKTIEEMRDSSISLEANMSRYQLAPPSLFPLARKNSIPLVLGSDAHSPDDLPSHVPEDLPFTEFGRLGFL
jgi:histidinol phosphatase-like PHP family hydrolase